ncbi:MAG: hypothetical protein HY698_11250 [Deltaproteobacteria bacterium]|nr:hypothetical protein [Deltaproteobacteria bacterium]
MSRSLLLAFSVSMGCAAAKPPPPPPYTPVNSPEPVTSCKMESTDAKAAREALLESDSGAAREAATRAVLAHAECERRHFDELPMESSSEQQFLDGVVTSARDQFQTTQILYQEVVKYGLVRWVIGGNSRLGDLHAAFADKMRGAPVPGDLRAPVERASWIGDIEDIARVVEAEAKIPYQEALLTADQVPAEGRDEDLRRWIQGACAGLMRVDPPKAQALSMCRR